MQKSEDTEWYYMDSEMDIDLDFTIFSSIGGFIRAVITTLLFSCGLLTALKLLNMLSWGWFWVLSPVLIPFVLCVFLVLGLILLGFVYEPPF